MRLKTFKINRYKKWLLPTIVLCLLIWAASISTGVNFNNLGNGLTQGMFFLTKMFPPDWHAFIELLSPTFDTLLLAFLGTILGTLLSIFFAILASVNITNIWIRNFARTIIGIERSIPELFILLILIAAFGLGTMPAVIALMLGCVGMLGKLIADAIEEINPVLIESLESVGANKLQIIFFGILPEILPTIISYALFRFEINIRLSVLLGAIGAGGIGYELEYAFSMLEYHKALSALLIVLLLVFVIEKISITIRKKLKTTVILK